MRSWTDERGGVWDVTVGRESWGAQVLLFARREGREFRAAMVAPERRLDAEQELATLSDRELGERFAAAQRWEPG